MSLATLCRPSGRHERLQPGQKCDNCGTSYETEQEIKRIVEAFRRKAPTGGPDTTRGEG